MGGTVDYALLPNFDFIDGRIMDFMRAKLAELKLKNK